MSMLPSCHQMLFRVGRYEILAEIAKGGMATVYLARAQGMAGFERLFAAKILHAHLASEQSFVHMLLDEARLAAAIRHPNVVGIVDIVESSRGPVLVMEFVDGPSLRDIQRAVDGALPLAVVLRIMLDALAGLHAAHQLVDGAGRHMKLVHRDVSPHNIVVDVEGVTRLTDFGIAHAAERLQATATITLKGKLGYVAPDQVLNLPVDARSDVYSAGVVLWEALTGVRLHQGKHDAAVLASIMKGTLPRPSEVRPNVPSSIDEVCMRALAKDRDQRLLSAAAMASALQAAADAAEVTIASRQQIGEIVRTSGAYRSTAELLQNATASSAFRTISPPEQSRTRWGGVMASVLHGSKKNVSMRAFKLAAAGAITVGVVLGLWTSALQRVSRPALSRTELVPPPATAVEDIVPTDATTTNAAPTGTVPTDATPAPHPAHVSTRLVAPLGRPSSKVPRPAQAAAEHASTTPLHPHPKTVPVVRPKPTAKMPARNPKPATSSKSVVGVALDEL